MSKKPHTYSRLTEEAVMLLGNQIKFARKSRRMSESELAARAGIARSTLQKIEQGNPTINIGLAFEAATVAGVPLFVPDTSTLAPKIEHLNNILTLMPKQIRKKRREVKDDF
ncbi:MAG: helix-turn-helix transcriptional regulator [Acidobacteria bacterium]|uniref:Helix-turn-helix transcriptional regulator n=1 Tax=Candidatus Polarisedimenticola svalbardensis TaxID=2886004 RepID=A0A8J6XW19_9BACT|nr:helix-turn-helix transcriptional regulator [Candidatus Polarisedimenticola svalbardensis]